MGAHIIAPRGEGRVTRRGTLWVGWTLALLAMAGFAWLGFWQYGRMQEKQALLDRVDQVLREKRGNSLDFDLIVIPSWVRGDAELEPVTFLLDNQMREQRAGVRVYCLVARGRPERLLVDLGWLPIGANREMPDVTCPTGRMHVDGLLAHTPSSGIRVGAPMQRLSGDRWLMTRMDLDAIRDATGFSVLPWVVRLDPKLPIGYARDLDVLPNTLPPERHLGYAVQWWALSLAVFVTALVLTFRKKKSRA